jgi:hypothetical protein
VNGWRFGCLTGESGALLSPCERYRYELTRGWDPTRPRLVFVGLNPSTADATQDDPTIRRILGFANLWGCGSLLMLNLFGLRSTDPRGLRKVEDPNGPGNDASILKALSEAHERRERVVLGWGAWGHLHDRGFRVASWALEVHGAPECFGLTRSGHPRHPLYLRSDTKLVRWSWS